MQEGPQATTAEKAVDSGIASGSAVADNGTITVPSFQLPYSTYASDEARQYVVRQFRTRITPLSSINARRAEVDSAFYQPKLAALTCLYPHRCDTTSIAGVRVDTFVPDVGIAQENRERVLVNLHGGSFMFGGGGPGGAAESIPIAGLGRIKVISVDYRLAPEHRFPAASEDLAAVYRELLKHYAAENIGIYGCSAGGTLAAQAVAWFRREGLPVPGAIGILCASTHRTGEGDSSQIWPRMQSSHQSVPGTLDPDRIDAAPYFIGASPHDPFVVPAVSVDVLRAFPPTLFVTGSRASEMSSAAQSHLELVELGVRSQLLIFDGMEHGFVLYPIPEATRAHGLVVKFFLEHLGSQPTHGGTGGIVG
jgi:monoterpene epsilon-lactone hydrolase